MGAGHVSRPRRTNTDPLRAVVDAKTMVVSSLFSDFKFYVWNLTLECGHVVDRPFRRPNLHGKAARGFAAMHHPRSLGDALPPPKRARCPECARQTS